MKGLVIRTVFNNQKWRAPCREPWNDPQCYKCRSGNLFINRGNPIQQDEDGFCIGTNPVPLHGLCEQPIWCWEQVLCVKYFWGNPTGKWRQVETGMPVFFVYQEPDRTYTLWGWSTIREIRNDTTYEYPLLFFEPFEPLPEERWAKNLTSEAITGIKRWNMPFYRYLDKIHTEYLLSLVEGKKLSFETLSSPSETEIIKEREYEVLKLPLRKDIFQKLGEVAWREGRDIKDLIREAVADILRRRGVI